MVFKELLTEKNDNWLLKKGGFSTKSKKEKSLHKAELSRINSVTIKNEAARRVKKIKTIIWNLKLPWVVSKNENSEFRADFVEISEDFIFKRFCILKPKKKMDSISKVNWYFLPLVFLFFSRLGNKWSGFN